MVFNPCPCMPLGKGVNMLAVLNAMIDGILSVICVVNIILILIDGQPYRFYPYPSGFRVCLLFKFPIGLVLFLLDIALSIVLFMGAKKRSLNICKIWMTIMGFILLLCLICFFNDAIGNGYMSIFDVWVFIWIPFKFYEILVVYAFCREVTDGVQAGNGQVLSMTDTRPLAPTTNPPNNYTQTPQ